MHTIPSLNKRKKENSFSSKKYVDILQVNWGTKDAVEEHRLKRDLLKVSPTSGIIAILFSGDKT